MKPLPLVALAIAGASAACGGGAPSTTLPTPSATPSASASPSSAASAKPAADDGKWITPGPAFDASSLFADQKLDAIAKKLEGVWVVSAGALKQAWEIKGNVVTVVDKRETSWNALTVTSPCTLEMRAKDGSYTESHFALDGDALYTGLGDFGVKQKDGTIIACVSNGVYVFKKNKCDKHMLLGGEWRGEPALCTVTKDGFEVSGDTGGKLKLHGSVLLSGEPDQVKSEKVPDLEAGKAKIAK